MAHKFLTTFQHRFQTIELLGQRLRTGIWTLNYIIAKLFFLSCCFSVYKVPNGLYSHQYVNNKNTYANKTSPHWKSSIKNFYFFGDVWDQPFFPCIFLVVCFPVLWTVCPCPFCAPCLPLTFIYTVYSAQKFIFLYRQGSESLPLWILLLHFNFECSLTMKEGLDIYM